MDKCIEKAKQAGIGMVSVKNGGHFGIAGYYAQKAAEQGMIGFCFANSAPVMAAFGGRGTVLGNSPVSVAFPKGADEEIMLCWIWHAVMLHTEKYKLRTEKARNCRLAGG
jgi:LDH2 family malate/lactate/ureidoglycolate dehydrogenase